MIFLGSRHKNLFLLWAVFAPLLVCSETAIAATAGVVKRSTTSNTRVDGLDWTTDVTAVKIGKTNGKAVRYITLQGRLNKAPGTTLFAMGRPVIVGKDGQFQINVGITKTKQQVEIQARDQTGSIQSEVISLAYANVGQRAIASTEAPVYSSYDRFSKSPSSLNINLGFSIISYQQTGIQDFAETALTPKLSYTYSFSPQFDMGLNGFITGLPLSSNRTDTTARFLGLNARVGYTFTSGSWKFSLMGGVYYSTMIVTNSAFGYNTLIYPQFYPLIKKTIDRNSSAFAYVKLVPLSSLSDLSQKELSVGGGYSMAMGTKNQLSFTIDYSDLETEVVGGTIHLNSITFGSGITF